MNKLDKDFEATRKAYQELADIGLEAVQKASKLADATEHPRMYEVLFAGMKNVADMNDKIIELHRRRQVIDLDDPNDKSQLAIEDKSSGIEAFNGTTEQLAKALEDGTIDVEFLEVQAQEDADAKFEGYENDDYDLEDE